MPNTPAADAAARPEPGRLPQLRRRRGATRSCAHAAECGHRRVPRVRRAQRRAQLHRRPSRRSARPASTSRGPSATRSPSARSAARSSRSTTSSPRRKPIEQMGADSLCIKDMAGLLSPDDAATWSRALKRELSIPVVGALALHERHGLHDAAAGHRGRRRRASTPASRRSRCAPRTPPSSRSSPRSRAARATPASTSRTSLKLGEYFETIAPKYREFLDDTKLSIIDTGVLSHQIPGGMFSNMVAQLRQADALRPPRARCTRNCRARAASSASRRWSRRPARSSARRRC